MKKRLCAICLLAVMVFLCTGCMSMTYNITIDKNGNMSAEYEMMMDKQYVDVVAGESGDPFSEYKKNAEKYGYTITDMETDTTVGFKASGVKDVPPAQFADIIAGMGFDEDLDNKMEVKKGLIFNTYSINGKVDMSGDEDSETAAAINQYIKIKMNITVPDNVQVKDKTNAIDENTFEWVLQLGKKNEIILEYKQINYVGIAILLAILVVIILAVVLIIKKAKAKKALEAEIYEGQISMEQLDDEFCDHHCESCFRDDCPEDAPQAVEEVVDENLEIIEEEETEPTEETEE